MEALWSMQSGYRIGYSNNEVLLLCMTLFQRMNIERQFHPVSAPWELCENILKALANAS